MNMNARKKTTTAQNQPSPSRKKMMIWIGSSVFAVALTATGTYYAFFKPSLRDAPPVKSEPKKIASYLASSKFKELPQEDKINYLKQLESEQPRGTLWRADIPKDEREKLRENVRPVMQVVMKERLDSFFKKSPEEQQAELAKMAEERKARQEQQAQGGPRQGGGGPGGPGGGRNNPARTKARFEGTDSNTRAEMTQMRKLMQQQQKNTPAPTPVR
ncbi:MAG: hypothetical protein ACYC4Q_03760 [Victivallaceae bacterium]